MSDTIDQPTLQQLGDTLTSSTERDLRRRRGRTVRRVLLASAVIAVIGTGTAAAAGLLSPKQVPAGMPAGAVIFDQTHPACTADSDGSVFRCTLSSAPAPESADFTGSKQVLVVDGLVAGGCIGQDAAGLRWDCYLGQDAVRMEIITQDYLGQPSGPTRG